MLCLILLTDVGPRWALVVFTLFPLLLLALRVFGGLSRRITVGVDVKMYTEWYLLIVYFLSLFVFPLTFVSTISAETLAVRFLLRVLFLSLLPNLFAPFSSVSLFLGQELIGWRVEKGKKEKTLEGEERNSGECERKGRKVFFLAGRGNCKWDRNFNRL